MGTEEPVLNSFRKDMSPNDRVRDTNFRRRERIRRHVLETLKAEDCPPQLHQPMSLTKLSHSLAEYISNLVNEKTKKPTGAALKTALTEKLSAHTADGQQRMEDGGSFLDRYFDAKQSKRPIKGKHYTVYVFKKNLT